MSSIDARVVANYETAEYGKFVQLTNNTEFPAVSVIRQNHPNATGVTPLTAMEVYPKFGVITYDARLGISNSLPFGDNGAIDAFGRLRTSSPKTLFDAKHVTGKLPHVYDEALSGSATSTYDFDNSLVNMSTTAANSFVIRQTFTHFNYQPGKSLQAFFTGLFHPQTNIIKRIGLYQGSSAIPYLPKDGIYLESSNNTISFVVAKGNGTTQMLSAQQTQWNIDRLDGTGPSGLTIDFTKAQIIAIDYEWLGLGRVRCGFVLNGKIYYAHQFTNFNALTAPYMKSPDHPVRYEIRQTGPGSGLLRHICSSVNIEGGEDDIGTPLVVELSGGIVTDTSLRPLLVIRLHPNSIDLVAILKSINVYNTGANPIIYKLIMDPVITGGTLNQFRQADGFTDVQFTEGSASRSLSGGYELYGGYVGNGNSAVAYGAGGNDIGAELSKLGSKIDGTPINLVIAGRALKNSADSVYVAANFILRS